jgi:hypothetical protein
MQQHKKSGQCKTSVKKKYVMEKIKELMKRIKYEKKGKIFTFFNIIKSVCSSEKGFLCGFIDE